MNASDEIKDLIWKTSKPTEESKLQKCMQFVTSTVESSFLWLSTYLAWAESICYLIYGIAQPARDLLSRTSNNVLEDKKSL